MGRTTTYGYDAVGRLLTRTYPDTTTASFTYTPVGQRATATDARGVTRYTYDARNRLTALVYPDGRELGYGYDATGARTTLTAKIGPWSGTTTTSYDASRRPTAVQDPAGRWTTLTYDAAGHRTSLTHPNGVATTYGYDERGRVKTIDAVGSGSLQVTSFAYTLDAAGRRTRIDEALGTTRTYGYDSVDRLTSETVTSAQSYVKTFTYDAVGNRLTQATTGAGAGTVNYAYDTRDRLQTENGITYGYNANGDVTSKSGEATYAWDYEDRLTTASMVGDGSVSHVYDVDGNRVKTTVSPSGGSPVVTNVLVDPSAGLSHVVAETDGTGALTALYVRAGNELLAVLRPTGATWSTRWVHSDALGSVRALTDEAGIAAEQRGYEAFGTMNVQSGTDPLPYRFAGEPFDATTKLAYHRARWMDARIGRFHGMDRHRGNVQEPASLHRYSYASNEPVDLIDPSGNFSLGGISVGLGMAGILSTMSGCSRSPVQTNRDAGNAPGGMGTPGTREPVPQCARIYLANLPGFMMLPYERISIEYVAGGGLGQGLVGEMVFTGQPVQYTIKYASTMDRSLHPPTAKGLGLLAHELQHVADAEFVTPTSFREDWAIEEGKDGYDAVSFEVKARAAGRAVEEFYAGRVLVCP